MAAVPEQCPEFSGELGATWTSPFEGLSESSLDSEKISRGRRVSKVRGNTNSPTHRPSNILLGILIILPNNFILLFS